MQPKLVKSGPPPHGGGHRPCHVKGFLRLGYRPVWEVASPSDASHSTSCRLCDAPKSNHHQHYCLHKYFPTWEKFPLGGKF